MDFSHLLVEQKGKYFYENEHLQQSHETLESINCFHSIGVEYRSIFPVKIKTRPCVVLLRRRPNFKPSVIEISAADETENFNDSNDYGEVQEDEIMNEEYEVINDEDDLLTDADETERADDTHPDDEDQIIIETELKKPTKETKRKLRRLIEKHFRIKKTTFTQNDRTDLAPAAQKRSIKSNIKHIIKTEKIKEIIERISQLDLRMICDLEKETTKQCLLKVIDGYDLE